MSEAAHQTQSSTKNYLRNNQVEEMRNERDVLERTLRDRHVEERGNLEQQVRRLDQQIEAQSAPEVNGAERDRMERECAEIESVLQPMMPSDEAMRKNPPGTVGRHLRFDKAAKDRSRFAEGMLRRWKNNQLTLNRGSDDPDVANFERLRPGTMGESMLGAQIPGQQFFGTNPSPQYMDNYDKVQWSDNAGAEPSPVVIAPKPKRRGPDPAKMLVEMACGEMKDKRGRKWHEKNCQKCQEALAAQASPEA